MFVKPFDALRANEKEVEIVQCPPYDVVDRDEAKKTAETPHSFMRVIRPDVVASQNENIYETAAKELEKLVREGAFVRHGKPAFFIYSQTMGEHVQTGLIACVSADDYPLRIKRHELTRVEKEEERTKHITTTRAHTGQVFLTFRADDTVKRLLSPENGRMLYDVKTKNPDVSHRIYAVDDEKTISEVQKAFEKVESFYIADGHHRAAASVRAAKEFGGEGEWKYFMATIFPHDELKLLGYHRLIRDLGMDSETFIERLKEAGFDVIRMNGTVEPREPHRFGMYLDGKWYELRAMNVDETDPVKRLDVSIMQERILDPILNVKDPRTDPRIDFLGGIHGTSSLQMKVDGGEYVLAFVMYPTKMEDVMDVSDAELIMPPKSTWFEPKLRSGFLIHTF